MTGKNESAIFITNIIGSGSGFASRASDGYGVFIPPSVMKTVMDSVQVGDQVMAVTVPNSSDLDKKLPLMAVSLSLPIDLPQSEVKNDLGSEISMVDRVMNILTDTAYDDRWFTIEDMCAELGMSETRQSYASINSALQFACDMGMCSKVQAYSSSDTKTWFTVEEIKPEE